VLEAALLSASIEGLRLQVRPFEGETVTERAIFPAKPSDPVAIIVVEPVDPASAVTLVEVVVITKSWIAYVTVADAVLEPPVLVTVTM